MGVKFISTTTTKFTLDNNEGYRTLLWGDSVQAGKTTAGKTRIRAQGKDGWVPAASLGDESLLEIYVIDVGQGDSVLMKTPDGEWHLIDGGIEASKQMTRKGAANFVAWKFFRDLGRSEVALRSMILTHSDYDHYGGLIDVLSGSLPDRATPFKVSVANFYHDGIARFAGDPKLGGVTKGTVPPFPVGNSKLKPGGSFITELLDDKASFQNPPRPLGDEFDKLAKLVASVPKNVKRLSHLDGHLPGYGPADPGKVRIRVLGPILESLGGGKVGLRDFSSESVTRNGHSVVLRIDYDKIKLLLTGDLNSRSQGLLLSYHPAAEFTVDASKACHHGSEDVLFEFIKAMGARVTVISSGDNEDYSHPRPVIMGASGWLGRPSKNEKGEEVPPLLYSTELARSTSLGFAKRVGPKALAQSYPLEKIMVALKDSEKSLRSIPLATDLVYGLVNVRTDGKKILCATKEEKGEEFDCKVVWV
jgi:beta-lactamase superfamily II metal-dependent hydrolase